MGRLLKYEFKKQAFSKLVLAVILMVGELIYFYGILFERKKTIATASGLLIFFAIGSIIYVSFEAILTYSNELRTKTGYMLYLTPNSMYKIVGAKFLFAAIQIVFTGIVYFAVVALDMLVLYSKYSTLEDLINQLKQAFQINLTTKDTFILIFTLIASWLLTMALAFLAITLSSTFLANKKGKGLVSFALFIVINLGLSKLCNLILQWSNLSMVKVDVVAIIYYVICSVICYFVTSYMLDKKVSL